MTITRTTQVVHVPARMSRDSFCRVLTDNNSPAAGECGPAYDVVVKEGVDPAFALAVFQHESGFGKVGITPTYETKNPGNVRTSSTNAGNVIQTERGPFVKFASWVDGWRDLARRLVDPKYVYASANATTIEQIIPIWAPASDNNSPEGYIAAVVASMSAWEEGGTMPNRPYHVAISYGHNNTDGGDARERAQTPVIGAAVRDACRALGMEVRVVQDERGNGLGLDGVAQTVVDWDKAGWTVDLYLEVHSEGAGGALGVFAIYPDWDAAGDYDADAERVGRDAAVRISAAVDGLSVRGGGGMSEKQTGVGGQGFRLGIFRVTAPLKDHTTRLIIEYGAHDNEAEYQAVMSHIPQVAEATAAAFAAEAARLGFPINGTPAPQPDPPADEMDFGNGIKLSGGFLAYWRSHDGESTLGPPNTNEIDMDDATSPNTPENKLPGKRRVQRFQKGALIWLPELPQDYQVQELSIDSDLFRRLQAV